MKHYLIRNFLWSVAALCAAPWVAQGAELESEVGAEIAELGLQPACTSGEVTIAELHYVTGLEVVLSYDELSGDFTLVQEGPIGSTVRRGEEESLLDLFLALTPQDVPVPELLLGEPDAGTELPAELDSRQISPKRVSVDDLELPAETLAKSGPPDDWWTYWDDGEPGYYSPRTYWSSWFIASKVRYIDSYLGNYTPRGSAKWKWVRHRFIYKAGQGFYIQYEKHIAPWREQTITKKGRVKLWRYVEYDKNWSRSKWWRAGRFRR